MPLLLLPSPEAGSHLASALLTLGQGHIPLAGTQPLPKGAPFTAALC